MSEQPPRSPRQVAIADHLWDTFVMMSREMGVERDSLINQALFQFARQNGYLAPGLAGARPAGGAAEPTGRSSDPFNAPPPKFAGDAASSRGAPVAVPPAEDLAMADFDQGFQVSPPPGPSPEPVVRSSRVNGAAKANSFGPPPAAEPPPAPPAMEPSATPAASTSGNVLVLFAEGREVDRVESPRFLIGRGKHCDLIINSGKVSREHAAIIRDGDAYYIEDLGSSNGTWFDKKRITRRRIENGDEYFVCSEKITCRFE